MSVRAVAIAPSPTIRAATGIARSARATRATAGSTRGVPKLLAAPYIHVVFTLPHELAPLALQNKEMIYGLLFRFSAETLIEIARDPKHLGAEIGFFSVLHTWNCFASAGNGDGVPPLR